MKNILITGASQGIGFELAKEFAKNDNFNLYLVSRNKKKLEKLKLELNKINSNVNSYSLSIDLSKEGAIDILVSDIKNKIKHLDIVVNNAGYLVNEKFDNLSENQLLQCFNVNIFVPFYLTQKTLPILSQNAHTIFISSIGGINGTKKFPGLSAYSSSKGALITLTECLAEEYQDKSYKFNCLALGAVQTEMLDQAFPGYKAPLSASEISQFIFDFCVNGNKYFNGKVLPVALTTP